MLGFDATVCSQNCNIIQEIVKIKNLDSLNDCDNVIKIYIIHTCYRFDYI